MSLATATKRCRRSLPTRPTRVSTRSRCPARGLAQGGRSRAVSEWCHNHRCQGHQLDPEPGIDRLQPVAQQPGKPFGLAHWPGRTGTDRFDPVVDAVKQKIEAANPLPFGFQDHAKGLHQLARVAGERLGRTDRFGKGTADLQQIGCQHRGDRLGQAAVSLIEPPAEFRPEPQRQGCSWLRRYFADAVEPQPPEGDNEFGRQAQGGNRQLGQATSRGIVAGDQRRRRAR